MRAVGAAIIGAIAWIAQPASAQSTQVRIAQEAIPVVESLVGMPIAILDRIDSDPAEFWYRAMQTLCVKTGDSWCDDDLYILSDTTNQVGWTRVLGYNDDAGNQKRVCVVLPPRPGITSGFVATGLSSGRVFGASELPAQASVESWLTLMHVATCGATGDPRDEKRADAFATLSLALIEGHPGFVTGTEMTPARHFAMYRNPDSNRWAVNLAERILLDLWKVEAAAKLRSGGCQVNVVASGDLNTDYLRRDAALPDGEDCTSGDETGYRSERGRVSDGNLWIWTSGRYRGDNPVVGLPPVPYTPFKTFPSVGEAFRYAWQAADRLSRE